MTTVSKSFTAAGLSAVLTVPPTQSVSYSVTGTFTGFVTLEWSRNGGKSWEVFRAGAVDTGFTGAVRNETKSDVWFRFRAADTDDVTPMTGTAVTSVADVDDIIEAWRNQHGVIVFAVSDAGVIMTSQLTLLGADAFFAEDILVAGAITTTGFNVAGHYVYTGAATTRAAVRAEVGDDGEIGSLYSSTAGKLYLKVTDVPGDTDWQRVTTTAVD